MDVYGAMIRVNSKAEVLSKYGVDENYFDENIERILNS